MRPHERNGRLPLGPLVFVRPDDSEMGRVGKEVSDLAQVPKTSRFPESPYQGLDLG